VTDRIAGRYRLDSPDALARFERDAKLVAGLHHPNVIEITGHGVDAERPYLLTSQPVGETLQSRLDKVTTLPLADTVRIIRGAARGVAAAHAVGVVHGDVTAASLLLLADGEDQTAQVLGLGLAAGEVRADVCALARLAYLMLTGQPPGAGVDEAPTLSPSVAAFFERALSDDPAVSFDSAHALAHAFSAAAATERERCAHILIVDDEPDIEFLMRSVLRRRVRRGDYALFFAHDGQEALQVLAQNPHIDMVLSDINMPQMDGLTLLTRVSESRPLLSTIMVSAYGDMANIRAAMNGGAVDFVVKPFNPQELTETIDKTVAQVRHLRENLRAAHADALLPEFIDARLADRLLAVPQPGKTQVRDRTEATVLAWRLHGLRPAEDSEQNLVDNLSALVPVAVPEITGRRGAIVRFTGESATAVFTGDHHRERAIAAATAIRSVVPRVTTAHGPVTVALGIDTSVIVRTDISSPELSMAHHAVLGAAIHAAERLAEEAQPSEILFGE